MRPIDRFFILAALVLSSIPATLSAQTSLPKKPEIALPDSMYRPGVRTPFTLRRATTAIRIDGELGEEAWTTAARVALPFETDPGDNTPAPVETICRITFDDSNLYFSCLARDPEPSQIRAFITDRDDIFSHDRVGIVLDPFNDARRGFAFIVSALGVQLDMRFDEQEGFDDSWDAIWSSAGRITDEGYAIEAAIPFKSLRFPSGDDVQTWGFFAFRNWPRSNNVETQSMYWDRSNSCRLCQANLLTGIAGVSPGVNLEFNPTLTSSRTDERTDFPDGRLVHGSVDPEPGLDVRWGITPNLALNTTLNPDFSQIEADVAQLEVNNRFALFFPEKRPFFLEGADLFSSPLRAVFTRTIADPIFGTKLTGKMGANAMGAIAAQDEVINLLFPGNQGSSAASIDEGVTSVVGRYRRDVGSSSTLGALYTGREARNYHNRVGGVDAFVRPLSPVTVRFQYLRSQTGYPDSLAREHDQPTGDFGGNALRLWTQYRTRDWTASLNFRSLDQTFRADAGFIPQVDVRGINVWFNRNFWASGNKWYTRLGIASGGWHDENIDGRLTDQGVWMSMSYDGPMQSNFWINPDYVREYFDGHVFELMRLWSGFELQPTGNVSLDFFGNIGDAVDFANARKAFRIELNPGMRLRLGKHVDLRLNHSLRRFSLAGEKIFSASLSQVRAVYNFSPRMFVRVILQYRHTDRNLAMYEDEVAPEEQSLFGQFLFSYKVNPQTALFFGYSDNREGMIDAQLTQTSLTQTNRTFFLKLGYAWRP